MTYNEVLAEIMSVIKRPDKIGTARLKINAAISFYSLDNEFSRDFKEQAVSIDANEYTQAIAISDLTRMRKIKYIKRGGTNFQLKILPDAEMFKDCPHVDRWYIAGTNINISSSKLCSTMDLGYWMYPPVLTGSGALDSYWLLDVAPWMVIERACSEIFRDIGENSSSESCKISAREHYMAARKDLGISTQ